MVACRFPGRLLPALLAAVAVFGAAAVTAAEQPFPAMFRQEAIFLQAIERERNTVPDLRVTGISVPHHLLAADLMARGFWAAAENRYERVIVLSPDHFNRAERPLATTRRDFETVFGPVENDRAVSGALLEATDLFEELRAVRERARNWGATALHQALLRHGEDRSDRHLGPFEARGLGPRCCGAASAGRAARPHHTIDGLFPLPAPGRRGAKGSGNAQHHCGRRPGSRRTARPGHPYGFQGGAIHPNAAAGGAPEQPRRCHRQSQFRIVRWSCLIDDELYRHHLHPDAGSRLEAALR